MPQTYKVTTDQGVYNVTVDDPAAAPSTEKPGTGTALTLAATGAAIPKAADWALELATNPDAWKAGKVIGETAGGIAGLVKGGPIGAAGGMYVGGKAGWRLTNAAQRLATPVADALGKVAPYAQTLATLSGAQGVDDLAQIAEPNRRDIGVLGVGPSTAPIDPAHVPVLNTAIAKALEKLGYADLAKQFRGEGR